MATYDHGIASTETGSLGLYQSWEATDSMTVITADDADGDPTDYAVVRREMTVNINLIFDTTKTAPAAGTKLTCTNALTGSSKEFVIEEITHSQTNNDFIKVSVRGKRWPTNSLPN